MNALVSIINELFYATVWLLILVVATPILWLMTLDGKSLKK